MAAPDYDEQQTRVALRVHGRLADFDCRFEATVGGNFELSGRIDANVSLKDFVEALYRHFEESPPGRPTPFSDAGLPDFLLRSPRIGYVAATGTYVVGIDTEIDFGGTGPLDRIGLAFGFGSVGGRSVGAAASPKRRYVAGVRSTTPIDLGGIVGKESALVARLLGGTSLDGIGIVYATETIAESLTLFGTDAAQAFPRGLSFSARFSSGQSSADIVLPPPDAAQPAKLQPAAGESAEPRSTVVVPGPAAGAPLRYWKSLDKTIGPLQLRRIGGEWHDGKLGILLDAAVRLAGLKMGLAGLAVKVAPSKLARLRFEDLEFGLDGLELAFTRGPVSISGALLKTVEDGRVGYAGQASIRTTAFTIAAIGAYSTTQEGQASFFIYGAYAGIIGGPPCFILQGIAAGFGYNRAIALPDIDGVRDFPLVSLVLGQSENSSTGALEQLGSSNRFPAVTGQYWIAAGIKFTSFKLVEAFALLTVQFGARFEIALLGVATLRQPPAPVPRALVYVEMALKVRFAPDDGLLSVMAVLTANSYLFDTRCRLTGGFAFCIWFKPTDPKFENRAGDFVVTLGGYHPKFQVPAHYPKVPRVGFDWLLPECGVTIKGEAYFALTPSFIMAGARLSAMFRSGDFSAWFEAHADFLIGWAPLHYEAEVGVRIGAAFVLRLGSLSSTLSFEIGAMLQIWGPPFAGEAYVDLGIIAFTVPLGDRSAERKPRRLTWTEFSGQFLPADWLAVAIVDGIVEEKKGAGGYVIVNPSELRLTVESFVPVTEFHAGGMQPAAGSSLGFDRRLGIRPMGVTTLGSSLRLAFSSGGSMVHRPTLKSAPEALWSAAPMPDAKTAQTLAVDVIEDVMMGVQVLPAECREFRRVEVEVGIRTELVGLAAWPKRDWRHAPYAEPGARPAEFLRAWKRPDAGSIAALQAAGFDLQSDDIDLDAMAGDPAAVWLASPALVAVGDLASLSHGA